MSIIKSIKDCIKIFLMIVREMLIYVGSLFVLFLYYILFRLGEYFLDSPVMYIPLLVMIIFNIFVMLKYKKYMIKASIIGALMSVIIIVGANETICMQYSHFSSQEWKNNESIRHLMIDDLTKHYLKKDMTVVEVEELLGNPSYGKDEKKENLEQGTGYCYYYDGFHDSWGSNVIHLDIYFNPQNKVVSWEIYEETYWN